MNQQDNEKKGASCPVPIDMDLSCPDVPPLPEYSDCRESGYFFIRRPIIVVTITLVLPTDGGHQPFELNQAQDEDLQRYLGPDETLEK